MQFLFNTFNHNEVGRRSLEDIISIMGHQLKALGHQAVYQPANIKFVTADYGINVIIEGFTPAVIAAMAEAKRQGARFIILATEEPTAKGFNHGTQKEMVWRQETFPEAAKHCEGILHLVPGRHVTDWYAQFAPSAEAELGYAPTLMRTGSPFIEPDYEFGFYGSLTTRRLRVLKRLARHLGKVLVTPRAVKIVADFATQEDRDREMRRCKVIIQVRKFEAMGLVSSSRCNTALALGRAVVPEPHLLSHPWDEVIAFPQTMDGFFDRCMLTRGLWRQIWSAQLEKFKTKMSPERCIGQALAQIGITEQRAAA